MINILLLLVFLTSIGITAAWIAENPGSVTMHWFDYRIDTSLAFLLVLALLAAIIIAYTYIWVRRLIIAPDYFYSRSRVRRYERGLLEITRSVASLAASDPKEAEKRNRRAEKLLGRTPLTLLLSAQIARINNDDAKTHALLQQMLDHKETEYLAARSLSDTASKNHQLSNALALAQRAHAISPQGVEKVIDLQLKLGGWQDALQAVAKAARGRAITRLKAHHLRTIIYLQQAKHNFAAGNMEGALLSAKTSLKYDRHFIPAIAFTATLYSARKQHTTAIKLIMNAWKREPHENLADAFRDAIRAEPKQSQLKYAKKLAAQNPNSRESDLLLGQIAIAHQEWETARKSIKSALAKYESVRACRLMAELEQGEWNDFDAAGKWLAKSSDAMPDSSWICDSCGIETKSWDVHCPSCDSFDSLKWKQRLMKFVG